ncbi:AAA family ATPase [Niallia taxi]|uniref:AAA family ATPase n=1 Tax=Niallia taxi TaxID=2499688 RepID=UPI003F640F48
MFNNVKLTNFKLFVDNQIDFGPLTILAGSNGAGKSSVIQSLLIAKTALEVNEIKKDNISINGPYLMQLGTVKNIISNQASSDKIFIEINSNQGNMKLELSTDIDKAPTTLRISSLEENDINLNPFIYLNAERIGPRKTSEISSGTDLDLGYQGEYTSYVIYQAEFLKLSIHEDLVIDGIPNSFPKQVEAWFQTIIPDLEFTINTNFDAGMVTIKYKNRKDSDYFIPTATGFGITYALPIIVGGLIASSKPNSVFIVENPEAHLHPYGQSCIGKFLALLSSVGVQVITETHSEHVINGARLQLAKLKNTDLLKINFFKSEETSVVPISINELGDLSAWPLGFFDQQQEDLRELLRLRRR